jgi:nitroimidazol reductase NimA-like FMN-containing flavoprotein (pyridoxamine 5'-phosphate oxidase superfamily)
MNSSYRDFISHHHIAALASSQDNMPQVCTTYYVTDGEYIFFKSRTDSDHVAAFGNNPRVAITIYDHASNHEEKYGIQIQGSVERISDVTEVKRVIGLYAVHPHLANAVKKMTKPEDLASPDCNSVLYKITPLLAKMVDTRGDSYIYTEWEDWK